MEHYVSELGPDLSGHRRCGAASIASILLDLGWDRWPYDLMLEVASKIPNIEQSGTTIGQAIDVCRSYGLKAADWIYWEEALSALSGQKSVLAWCDNWILNPRAYPDSASWDALHI